LSLKTLQHQIRLLAAIDLPMEQVVDILRNQGVDQLKAISAGARIWLEPFERLSWIQAWMKQGPLPGDPTMEKVSASMRNLGIHPLSLFLSARSPEELEGYRPFLRHHLCRGKVTWKSESPPRGTFTWDLWKPHILLQGKGNRLELPDNLLVRTPLRLRDWDFWKGWPRRFHADVPILLERCRIRAPFPSDFIMGPALLAIHCDGLTNLPRGLKMARLEDCDTSRLASFHPLLDLTLMRCRRLSELDVSLNPRCLWVFKCPRIRRLPSFPDLATFTFDGAAHPPRFSMDHTLTHVYLSKLTKMRVFPTDFPPTGRLTLDRCLRLASLDGIRNPLIELNLADCPNVKQLPFSMRVANLRLHRSNLEVLPHDLGLERLSANDCPHLQELGIRPENLAKLEVSCCPHLDHGG